jgi:hypothetical protein
MPLAFVGALVLVVPAKKHDEPISNVMLYECLPRNRVVFVTAESFCEPQLRNKKAESVRAFDCLLWQMIQPLPVTRGELYCITV